MIRSSEVRAGRTPSIQLKTGVLAASCWRTVLCCWVLWALACDKDRDARSEPATSRVIAVQSKPVDRSALRAFCDFYPDHRRARTFVAPPLASGVATLKPGPTWINLWATWCKPCVEEMPRLLEWHRRLGAEGIGMNLQFLSVDASQEEVDRFRAAHPQTPPSWRLADAGTLPQWLSGLGLTDASSVPIQVLLDAQQRSRCIRTGPVSDRDYSTVKLLLSTP